MSLPYTIDGSQIVRCGRVVADLHGMATVAGRERAAVILAALNAVPARERKLMELHRKARAYAASGTATDDDVRGLAYVLTQLISEIAQ